MTSPKSPPTRRSDLTTRVIDGEAVIVDRSAGKIHHLNATAISIWQFCDGNRTIAEIAALVAASFDAESGRILADVTGTVANLRQLGLFVREDG